MVLNENPDKAFSSIELEDMFNTRRQVIHQALRKLETRGKIERKYIPIGSKKVIHAIIRKDKDED